MLGRERDALSKVSNMANQIMATAQSSRQRLSEQRGVFGGIMGVSGAEVVFGGHRDLSLRCRGTLRLGTGWIGDSVCSMWALYRVACSG